MTNHGIHVYFVDGYPQAIIGDDVQGLLEQVTSNCECISLSHVSKHACKDIVLETHNHGIRVFHYKADEEILYFVNESRDSFQSQVMIDGEMDLVGYDAWNNKLITVPYHKEGGKMIFTLSLNSCQSIILIRNDDLSLQGETIPTSVLNEINLTDSTKTWKVSSCKAIDYPRFTQEEITNNLQPFSDKHKTFSGHIAYTTDVDIPTEWIEVVNRGKKVYVNI